jgi:hypothetical protein
VSTVGASMVNVEGMASTAHSIPRSRAIRLLVYRGLAHVGVPQTEAAREAIR